METIVTSLTYYAKIGEPKKPCAVLEVVTTTQSRPRDSDCAVTQWTQLATSYQVCIICKISAILQIMHAW